jgi:hypothetical protein
MASPNTYLSTALSSLKSAGLQQYTYPDPVLCVLCSSYMMIFVQLYTS